MKLRNWVIRSGEQWITGDTGYRDPLDILCEIERRSEVIEMLGDVSEALSPRDVRVLYMYIKGCTVRDIEAKTGVLYCNVDRDIDRIANKILKAVKVFQCYHHVIPKESALEADVPMVKLEWLVRTLQNAGLDDAPDDENMDDTLKQRLSEKHRKTLKNAKKPHISSVGTWGWYNGSIVWKTRGTRGNPGICKVPEYFEKCFGDNDTQCTLCSPHNCSRRKTQSPPKIYYEGGKSQC